MGLPIKELYVTRTSNDCDELLLSAWKPLKKEDGEYHYPHETPVGCDMWIPNIINIKYEDGTIPVKIIETNEKTGIWLICYNDYFGNEQHLYNYKPRFVKGTKKFDYEYDDEQDDLGIHVATGINMKAGDGPIPVTLKIL